VSIPTANLRHDLVLALKKYGFPVNKEEVVQGEDPAFPLVSIPTANLRHDLALALKKYGFPVNWTPLAHKVV
jgi:hypothetical protein